MAVLVRLYSLTFSFAVEDMGDKQETEGDRQTDMAAEIQTERKSTPNEKEAI